MVRSATFRANHDVVPFVERLVADRTGNTLIIHIETYLSNSGRQICSQLKCIIIVYDILRKKAIIFEQDLPFIQKICPNSEGYRRLFCPKTGEQRIFLAEIAKSKGKLGRKNGNNCDVSLYI